MAFEHDVLEEAFGAADAQHYAWQTEAAFVAERERELVRAAFLPLGQRVLDIGCGEGATLFHLGAPAGAVGVDLFESKLEFARTKLPECRFVAGSAYELPFDAGSFDHVLVRDVVHHLEEPDRLMAECARVLEPGGRIDVLEPCRNKPLVFAHALAIVAERGELRSSPRFVKRLVGKRFRVLERNALQAFPVHRIVFHPRFGRPSFAEREAARALVSGFERLAGWVLPRWSHFYIHVRGQLC